MKILIDADGCPVVDFVITIAMKHNIEVLIICDTSHRFEREGIKTITVSKGEDSVDFALCNLCENGDVVITQDYGLAAMCLAKNTIVLNQDGMQYSNDNIDSLLHARHNAKKIRMGGGRLKGNKKRTKEQDESFQKELEVLLERLTE